MLINTLKIAIVVSRFNTKITSKLLQGAKTRCQEVGISLEQLTLVEVPGAVEIPITAQVLAKSKRYDCIICLGCVIRGETSHYEFVCQQVSYGCQRVALDHSIPVIFGILTTENQEQALARAGGNHSHKGREAIDTAIAMTKTLDAYR